MSRRRPFRALAALVLGALFAFVLAELALRWALFSDSDLAARLGARVRTPDAFGTPDLSERWWQLQRRFTPRERLAPASGPDAVLGWNGEVINAATGRNYEADRVGAKRPVLLYGDSFAQGVVAREARFQGLMESSALGTRFALLNHGVGGYGVDQAYLMFERTLDVWKDARPVVVFSIFVDSDLDRIGLAFRGWPKPTLELAERAPAERAERGLVVRAPATLDPDRWFESESSAWNSWLVDLATFRAGLVPETLRAALVERRANAEWKAELTTRVLEAVHARCVEAGVEHVVLLFHGPPLAPRPWTTWQVPCIERACERLGMRLVDTRPYFAALERQCGDALHEWYLVEGSAAGHLNEAGNRVAFEALADGIEGRSISEGVERVVALRRTGGLDPRAMRSVERELLGRPARVRARPLLGCVRSGVDVAEWFQAPGELVLALRASEGAEGGASRATNSADPSGASSPSGVGEIGDAKGANGAAGPSAAGASAVTEVEFPLDGAPLRFRASARAVRRPDAKVGAKDGAKDGAKADASAITLVARLDGRELARCALTPEGPERALDLDLDLAGGACLVLSVEQASGRAGSAWAVLRAPRFE
ncbi:MAG: SGNH/GDSL hydrolase family protein [Planctomycetes bacterium]|nr:SGNH/GDSL hydrolase family protein [Planctomycetota bacterium]